MADLFPEFAHSPLVFARAKEFWRDLTSGIACALGQSDEWIKWLYEEPWQDEPEQNDGAVVFSLYSARQHKGFRVQQSSRSVTSDTEPFVGSFTSFFGEGHLERPIPNLFIGTVPTEENLSILRDLIEYWFRTDVDVVSMNLYLQNRLYGPHNQKG